MLNIRLYSESDEAIWDNYVVNHPDGAVFHLTSWKRVVEQTFGYKSFYLLAEFNTTSNRTGTLAGVLPIFKINSLIFGNYLVSAPFAELGGALADNQNVQNFLINAAIDIAEKIKCDYLELRNRKKVLELPAKSLYYNFRREIFPDLDQNLKAIPRKARRMIRQGEKCGLTAEFGTHLFPEFYDIMTKSFHSLGTPIFSRKFFKNFIKIFGKKTQLLVIRNKENIPVATVLTFFFKKQVIPYYAGSDFRYRKLAPNDFMYWQLMRYGCEHKYTLFDFGRSKEQTGSYHFKRHWGFEPIQLAYQYHLVRASKLPDLSPANPKYRKKIELWKKLPLSATKILGPFIAKALA